MEKKLRAAFHVKTGEYMVVAAVLALTVCISVFIAFISSDEEVPLRLIMGLSIACTYPFMGLLFKTMLFADEATRAISFGMTRKAFFLYSKFIELLEIIIVTALVNLIIQDVDAYIFIRVAAIVFGVFMWNEGIVANSVMRYGKKVYIGFYLGMFVVMIGLSKLIELSPSFRDFLMNVKDVIASSNAAVAEIWIGIIIFILAGVFVNWITFRKVPTLSAI